MSLIDRIDVSWSSIENKEDQGLILRKSIAYVRSVGISIRIEKSRMRNEE